MSEKNNLFVAGCARSGTSALARLLGLHSKVVMGMERYGHLVEPGHFTLTKECFESARFLNIEKSDTFYSDFDAFHGWDPDIVEKLRSGSYEFIGDKRPGLELVLDELYEEFPKAKVIYIYRDVYEVAASWEKRAEEGLNWPKENNFKKAVHVWCKSLKTVLEAYDKGYDVAAVRYDDVFVNRLELKKLYKFIGLEIDLPSRIAYKNIMKNSERIIQRRETEFFNKEALDYITEFASFRFEKNLDRLSILRA